MNAGLQRLVRLAATLDRLRDALTAQISNLNHEKMSLQKRRATLEALMAGDQRFPDLTLGGGLKRLREIAVRESVIAGEIAGLQRRSASAYLKAKRVRELARLRLAERQRQAERLDLAERADRQAAASLRQASGRKHRLPVEK